MLIYGPGETTTPKANQVNPNICTLYLVVISSCITYKLGKQDLYFCCHSAWCACVPSEGDGALGLYSLVRKGPSISRRQLALLYVHSFRRPFPCASESSTCIDIGRTLCLSVQVRLRMKAEHVSALALGSRTCKYLRGVQRSWEWVCDSAVSGEDNDSISGYNTVEFQILCWCKIIN